MRALLSENPEGKRGERAAAAALFSHSRPDPLLILLLLSCALFIAYPLLLIFWRALYLEGRPGLSALPALFLREKSALFHSFYTASLSALFSTALGFLLSLRISSSGRRGRSILLLLLMMSLVSPPFLSSLSYIQLYGRRGLISWHLFRISYDPYNKWGIIAMQTLHFSSLNALFLLDYLESLDGKWMDAARDLGAGSMAVLRTLLLPLLSPALLASFGLSFLRSLSDFGTPAVIGGRYDTLASDIYLQIIGYGKMEKAAAMNLFLMLPAFLAFLLYRRAVREGERRNGNGRGRERFTMQRLSLPALFLFFLSILSLLYFTVLSLQYLCIFLLGFLKAERGVYHFTSEYLSRLFRYDLSSLFLSLKLSLAAALFGALFGLLLSYYMERRLRFGKNALDFLISLPYLLPGTCFGLAYIMAFHREPLKLSGTSLILVLILIFRQLPVGLRMGSTALLEISRELENAARDLGASKRRLLFEIILPQLSRPFRSAFLYLFTSSMCSAGAVIFLIDAGHKIAVYTLFDLINSGEYGTASLLSALMILSTVLLSALLSALFRYFCERKGKGRRGNEGSDRESSRIVHAL